MTIQHLKSKNLILFEVISGSKSFELAILTSHADIKASYIEYDELLEMGIHALIRIREEFYQ